MDNSLTTTFSLNENWVAEKEAVVFGVFEGEEIPCGLGFTKETAEKEAGKLFPIFSRIKRHFAHADFIGKFGETTVLYPEETLYKRIILCGLGKKEELNAEKVRMVSSAAIALLKTMNVNTASFTLFGAPAHSVEERLHAIFDGVALSLYSFSAYKKEPALAAGKQKATITAVEFLLPEVIAEQGIAQWQKRLERYRTIAEGVYFARNITNHPASVVTPKYLAETAQALAARYGVRVTVLEKKELESAGMNGILAVGAGSDNEPRLIVLEYAPSSTPSINSGQASSEQADSTGSLQVPEKGVPTVALVGKGVCFDSGGISLKPAENMDEMRMDMAGAAAAMATCITAARLALPVHIIAVVPAVENMPSSRSYRPGDIIKSASGKTIEVLNTDAEGRIILADALHYAVTQYKPDYVIDLATLTGACVVALGNHYAAALGNDEQLIDALMNAGKETGEKLWPLPLDEAYKKQIESAVADVKNIGGKGAGVITAAMFLKEFIGDHKRYAHLDIAGTAMLPEAQGYRPKGASGFGVRLLVAFLENLAKDGVDSSLVRV
ncbi:MAG: leucyl aminopeptidase [Patescibacteria group bacterium]